MFYVIKALTRSKKWKTTFRAEKLFFEVWEELAEYLENNHTKMLEGSNKSAIRMAGRVIVWMHNKREMYL